MESMKAAQKNARGETWQENREEQAEPWVCDHGGQQSAGHHPRQRAQRTRCQENRRCRKIPSCWLLHLCARQGRAVGVRRAASTVPASAPPTCFIHPPWGTVHVSRVNLPPSATCRQGFHLLTAGSGKEPEVPGAQKMSRDHLNLPSCLTSVPVSGQPNISRICYTSLQRCGRTFPLILKSQSAANQSHPGMKESPFFAPRSCSHIPHLPYFY